ncbi:uncharacterized protein BDR25DRAFT_268291 [Lindgomyces ingoldianus]|uniref:Uncharacterized protein n=1 Tax=Lindgomyces ingoldianus TaxID=673940 RepID=A0ACB6QIV1_9PLEO|nr:uncharacterized protein BDR25DRAFT_268291 [Lindgomyces ingoldianus]KAF2466802.1 hypothetical protein BDR25DRAFT_268291 [Lindgomyces ingoldianus]
MSSPLDKNANLSGEAEVSNCVTNLIHAFTNGLDIFKRLRERRRRRKERKKEAHFDSASSAELQLSNSLRRGPADIESSYKNHYSKAGDQFAKGDAIAHASLAETLIKLNTGLVGIIAAFLNHDSKSSHLNLDYKSLTNLSDASRAEAVESLNQLYQRLSHSQLQVYRIGGCPRCGSMKHQVCMGTVGGNGHTPKGKGHQAKRKNAGSKSRSNVPTITRVPVKKSSQTQLAVVRPRNRRTSSSSSASSTRSPSTALSSTCPSPLNSPLPQYAPVDPLLVQSPNVGVLPKIGRRRAGSVDEPRPTTWPHMRPDNTMPLQLPPPKVPSPRKGPLPKEKHSPSSPVVGPSKRRTDKATPSTYTFASDSTKLGEIPQRNWTTPWDYEEADRLNADVLVNGYPQPAGESKPKVKKGLFGFLRRGTWDTS